MRITNKHGLPKPFVNLFHKQVYSKGHARMSVTELINSPRIVALKGKHGDEIEEDISDRFWALMGTNIHRILEEGADDEHLTEERLFHEVEGWVVSGGIDVQRNHDRGVDLIDWKFTSAYAVMSAKPEWEQQLNCYAWLLRKAKQQEPNKLFICAIVRDWDKNRAGYEASKGYPHKPVVMLPIRKWKDEDADLFIRTRIRMHKGAGRALEWGDGLPLCTDEDRWIRGTSYAALRVRKDGGEGAGAGAERPRRATKVFQSRDKAESFAAERGLEVVERKGEPIRCVNNYCGVARWCDQFNGGG